MACCDFVVAAEDLRVSFPEVRRGLVAALVVAGLRRRLRPADLAELLLVAEPIDAVRALSMGLVDRVVPDDRLLPEADRIAASVLKGAPEAVRQTKRLLSELVWSDPSQVFPRALEFHKRARASQEAQEGIAAFRQRREPRWPTACLHCDEDSNDRHDTGTNRTRP